MNTVKINDLESSKNLDAASMKNINGGLSFPKGIFGDVNQLGQSGQGISSVTTGGGGLGSPTIGTTVGVNPQIGLILSLDHLVDLGHFGNPLLG
jgi:hypothetical protein